jgi:flagellar assembly protein FliH
MTVHLELRAPLRDLRLGGNAPAPVALRGLVREDYERGYRDGQQALREQLAGEQLDLHEMQTGVIAALWQAVPGVVRDTEQALAVLALEVARKLVADLPVTPETIASAVREAIAQVEESTEFHIHLHPEDLALLRRVESAILQPAAPGVRFHFHAAPDISRGGCLVKTRFGVIDARRETKFELLKKIALG